MSRGTLLTHFEEPGKLNTQQTLEFAYDRGKKAGLNEVVIASTTGETAYKAMEIF